MRPCTTWALWVACLVDRLDQVVQAYIPAQATNDTSRVSLSQDFIQLSYEIPGSASRGLFKNDVSRQLVADNSTQVGTQYAARGALVHFAEHNATQPPAEVPWVAFINCDRNETDASDIDDIFTLTRDHGAVAALLFTTTAETCLINQEYIDDFEKPIDVYATTKRQTARLISSPFMSADTNVFWFNSQQLNASSSSIYDQLNDTISLDPDVSNSIPESDSSDSEPTSSSGSASSSRITLLEPGLSHTNQVSAGYPQSDNGPANVPTIPTSEAPPPASAESADAGSADDGGIGDMAFVDRRALLHPTPSPHAPRKRAPQNEDGSTTTISDDSPPAPSASAAAYMIAVLANKDAQLSDNSNGNSGDGSNGDGGQDGHSSGGNTNLTGLAMIILYAITGAVTFLFLVVIINGAIKAIRHPERYGPRARMGARPPQTRARGITRAILDTFPVIRHGRENGSDQESHMQGKHEDVAMRTLDHDDDNNNNTNNTDTEAIAGLAAPVPAKAESLEEQQHEHSLATEQPGDGAEEGTRAAATQTDDSAGQHGKEGQAEHHPAEDPTTVNDTQTCPICVCDFEADEELRVLPCAGRHRFHKDCIDPWLLDVSSLCPLCRWDVAQDHDDVHDDEEDEDGGEHGRRQSRRFTLSSTARRVMNASAATRRAASFGQHTREDTGDTGRSGFSRHRFRTYLLAVRQGGNRAGRQRNATEAAQHAQQEQQESSS